jgi:hypothetical protein
LGNQVYDGSAYLQTAALVFRVNGTVAAGSAPTDILLAAGAANDPNITNERMRITSGGNVGVGVSGPQGRLHAHDGTGGMIFVTKTGINSTTPQVIIPNATGDIMRGISGLLVASDGTTGSPASFALTPADYLDVTAGSVTLRLEVLSTGALQVKRQGGTGTGSLVLLGCWM